MSNKKQINEVGGPELLDIVSGAFGDFVSSFSNPEYVKKKSVNSAYTNIVGEISSKKSLPLQGLTDEQAQTLVQQGIAAGNAELAKKQQAQTEFYRKRANKSSVTTTESSVKQFFEGKSNSEYFFTEQEMLDEQRGVIARRKAQLAPIYGKRGSAIATGVNQAQVAQQVQQQAPQTQSNTKTPVQQPQVPDNINYGTPISIGGETIKSTDPRYNQIYTSITKQQPPPSTPPPSTPPSTPPPTPPSTPTPPAPISNSLFAIVLQTIIQSFYTKPGFSSAWLKSLYQEDISNLNSWCNELITRKFSIQPDQKKEMKTILGNIYDLAASTDKKTKQSTAQNVLFSAYQNTTLPLVAFNKKTQSPSYIVKYNNQPVIRVSKNNKQMNFIRTANNTWQPFIKIDPKTDLPAPLSPDIQISSEIQQDLDNTFRDIDTLKNIPNIDYPRNLEIPDGDQNIGEFTQTMAKESKQYQKLDAIFEQLVKLI